MIVVVGRLGIQRGSRVEDGTSSVALWLQQAVAMREVPYREAIWNDS